MGRLKKGTADVVLSTPVDLHSGAIAKAEQLVGNDLRNLCAHLPAALHLPFSNQHAPQDGGVSFTYSWRPAQIQHHL